VILCLGCRIGKITDRQDQFAIAATQNRDFKVVSISPAKIIRFRNDDVVAISV
jgi:hypothetical protein